MCTEYYGGGLGGGGGGGGGGRWWGARGPGGSVAAAEAAVAVSGRPDFGVAAEEAGVAVSDRPDFGVAADAVSDRTAHCAPGHWALRAELKFAFINFSLHRMDVIRRSLDSNVTNVVVPSYDLRGTSAAVNLTRENNIVHTRIYRHL